jgi:hypothetical protein
MKANKFKTHTLEKCYAIAPLKYNGEDCILVAAEKVNKCLLFDLDGNLIDTIWEEPGGTMSMVQIPGSNGQFLATQKFYSPNNSQEAKLVLVTPNAGSWHIKTIAHIPFVHRFDIITKNNQQYLIACTIKSQHHYKDDWDHPGEILVCELPKDLETVKTLELTVIKDNLLKNHGYCRIQNKDNQEYALVGCDNGIYEVIPPDSMQETWKVNQIISDPCSDMRLIDFDLDGKDELLVISPFHGDQLKVYKNINNCYELVYTHEVPLPFGHAIWTGTLYNKQCAIFGHRQGERDLLMIHYQDGYKVEVLDHNVGPTNVYQYRKETVECLVSTNREIDEIAFYTLHL